METLICSSPDLSIDDEKLASIYKANLKAVSESGRQSMRDGQRSWLKYVRALCFDNIEKNATEKNSSVTQEKINCLQNEYVNREAELDKSVLKTDNLTVFSVDQFEARETSGDDEGGHPGIDMIEFSYPQIDRPKDQDEQAWNAFIKNRIDKYKGNDFDFMDISVRYTLSIILPNVISTTFDEFIYGHGAAHGNLNMITYNWLLPQKREIKTEDVFSEATDWRGALAKLCLDILQEQDEGTDSVPVGVHRRLKKRTSDVSQQSVGFSIERPAEFENIVTDPRRWTFTAEGLDVQFNTYEVGSYSLGYPDVIVPWKVLRPYLLKNPPVPVSAQGIK